MFLADFKQYILKLQVDHARSIQKWQKDYEDAYQKLVETKVIADQLMQIVKNCTCQNIDKGLLGKMEQHLRGVDDFAKQMHNKIEISYQN